MESIRMNRIKIKTLHFHPNQHRTKRPTGFIRPTATTRYSSPTTQKRETAWDKNRIIQTIKKAENLNKIKAFCPFLCMREMGLEPTRAYTHKILSLACLPIPALPHVIYKKTKQLWPTVRLHAEEGTWTLMVLLPHGPEPCASANSAIPACTQYIIIFFHKSQ